MIGQNKLRDTFSDLIKSNKLPRFIILIGGYGSGRQLMSKWLSAQLNVPCVISELGVDSVRQIIDSSYKTTIPTMYVIPNANKLSTIAQNALLKITEEPPNDAYYVITVENGSQILNTLLNRSITFTMQPYTESELKAYLKQTYPNDSTYYGIVLDICDTMGEINDLMSYNLEEFIAYMDKVFKNVATVSGSNSFKIADSLAIKDTDSGYDLSLFFKAFKAKCMNELLTNKDLKYADGVVITNKYLQELQRIRGVNKGSLFDMWLLDTRKKWRA